MSQGYFDAYVNRIGKEAVNFAAVDELKKEKGTTKKSKK